MCDQLTKKRKRSFAKAWLSDDRYKSWICKVSSDNSLYYCNICNKNFPCSSYVSRHVDSACHKNSIKDNFLDNNNNENLQDKKVQYKKNI